MQLLGGFSPINALKQLADSANPFDGTSTNYDVFGNLGTQRSGGQVQGVNTSDPGYAWYDTATGQSKVTYKDGRTDVVGQGYDAAPTSSLGGRVSTSGYAQPASTEYYGRGGTGRNAQGYTFDEQQQAEQTAFEAQSAIDQATQYLGQIPEQERIFNQNLDNTYANYRAGLQQTYDRNEQDYNKNLVTTAQDSERERWNADRNVAQKYGALQRLFGMSGAGGSQAATMYAPGLLAQIGTQNRNQIQGAYDKNVGDLNFNWNRYGTDFNNSVQDMEDQKENARRAKAAEFETTRNDLNSRVLQGRQAIDYAKTGNLQGSRQIQQQANQDMGGFLGRITALGASQVTPTARDVAYKAPTMQQYESYNPSVGANQQAPQGVSSFYTYMLNKNKEDQNQGY